MRQDLQRENAIATSLRTVERVVPLNGHDPYAYLRDVLERLLTHPVSRVQELLPHHWQPAIIAS